MTIIRLAWLLIATAGLARAATVDFAHQIVPILRAHCGECHTGDKKKGGLSLNTRASLLAGGENGVVVEPGQSAKSKLIAAILSKDPDAQMPPKGKRVPAEKVKLLQAWIDAGLPWEEGFAFRKAGYEPPLKPRRPELPRAVAGRTNAVDRILDAYLQQQKLTRPQPLGDAAFARRVYLDVVGLLPEPEALEKFLADKSVDKRAKLVRELLANDTAYAEHWLTFWNDLLRNDYGGTGFITGGRKQISKWLYGALIENKPYDQFVRELISPTPESAGFSAGIQWRGTVSAGQTVEIQFAQNVGQAFLGINLKCASCHDSFIDRWKLDDAYGLAAIYASKPMEIHRCDKPIGKTAQAAWLFPELGQVKTDAPQPERLQQLAALMTHADNGRFTRTIVNRLWHRLMGRGIVHPVDAMQAEPWNADLLDFLAVNLADNGYDLKKTIELICLSQAYQSKAQVLPKGADDHGYVYTGPRAKRLTAEQFVDAIWQLTGAAPTKFDAAVMRGKPDPNAAKDVKLSGKWIWSYPAASTASPAGETITLRRRFELKGVPTRAGAVITCDNSYTLYINGQNVQHGDNWETPGSVALESRLRAGSNEMVIVAKNGGTAPNPAALFFEARIKLPDGQEQTIASDAAWEWTKAAPDNKGHFKPDPTDWQPAVPVANPNVWASRVSEQLAASLNHAAVSTVPMVRAALLKSDFLMRTLGRPNRDQIVSTRPNDLSTLEAIDLANGQALADTLARGAQRLVTREWKSPDELVRWLYAFALSRLPTADELTLAREALGPKPTKQSAQDLMWAMLMQPEFQLVR